jgi:acyl-coenzyme A synthetase/AMP-(fatty) acid ligase
VSTILADRAVTAPLHDPGTGTGAGADLAAVTNVAAIGLAHIDARPDHPALIVPTAWDDQRVLTRETCSYGELGAAVSWWQRALASQGVEPGHRVMIMAPLSIDFYAAALAVLAGGCTLVLVDRGMSLGRVRASVASATPDAVVLAPEMRRLRALIPETRRIPRVVPVPTGPRPWRRGSGGAGPLTVLPRDPDDEAIVTFTSGSTGKPKGADRTHGTLIAQHRSLAAVAPYRSDDVDISAWPVVVMHALGYGTTSVLPPVPRGRLGEVAAEALLASAIEHGATQLHGPPAFLWPVLERARRRGARPGLRRIVASGGPVSVDLCRAVRATFPEAEGILGYGSTEAEPVALCHMAELVAAADNGEVRPGAGLLVGWPVDDIDIRILALDERGRSTDRPVSADEPGRWGEIAFSGPHVLPRFFQNPAADAAARVRDEHGDFLRSGDIGRIDELGRVWLGGRVADVVRHRGRLVHTYEVEPVLDALAGVHRSALLEGPRGAEVFIDTAGAGPVPPAVADALNRMGLGDVYVHGPVTIPVDGRHHSKVDRPTMRRTRRRILLQAQIGARRTASPPPATPETSR